MVSRSSVERRFDRVSHLTGSYQRVRLILFVFGPVFAADRKGDVALLEDPKDCRLTSGLRASASCAGAMGRDKNFINHRGRVLVKAEWVEGGCGIGIE